MSYVDGFVLPVPKKNLRAYRKMAQNGAKLWQEHGALEYRECVGEDLDVKMGRSFKTQLRLKPGETVVFSWIVYRSRADRDRVNAKVMKDPRMANMPKKMPFDVKRMCYGGFETIVETSARAGARAGGRTVSRQRTRTPRAEAEAPPAPM